MIIGFLVCGGRKDCVHKGCRNYMPRQLFTSDNWKSLVSVLSMHYSSSWFSKFGYCLSATTGTVESTMKLIKVLDIILLHDWAGNMGKYSVRGWQYWPDRREGQYIT